MTETILALLLLILPSQLGRHFWPPEAYLFGLRVDYLSPTLYLQDLLIFLLLIFSVKKLFQTIVSEKKHLIGVGLYGLIVFLNLFFSPTPIVSIFSWLRLTELVFLGWFISQRARLVFSLLGRFLPVILTLEALLGLGQVLRQSSLGGLFWLLGERTFTIFTPGIARGAWRGEVFLRPYGTFSHPNSLAGFVLVALILLLGKGVSTRGEKIAAVLGFGLLLLAFSRAAWLAAFVLGVIFLVSQLKAGLKKNFPFPRLPYLAIGLALPLLTYFFSQTTIDSTSFSVRRELAEFALSEIRSSPMVGLGAGRFVISLSQNRPVWQWLYWLQPVHNIFLLMAAETGFLGLAVFVFWFFGGLFRLLNETKGSARAVLFAIGAILLTGLFDHYWLTLIQNQLLLAITLGLGWGRNEKA
jgi:O-antigen ligase